MRISAERIGLAEQRTNPLGERELILRGLAIPSIENLAATRDAFDTIDFTDNRISRLENFPRMQRLVHLMLSGNVIDTVDATNLSKNVPNIKYIQLNHNHVSSLKEVSNLGKACPKLEILCLVGNPVTRKYYSFASWKSTTLSPWVFWCMLVFPFSALCYWAWREIITHHFHFILIWLLKPC